MPRFLREFPLEQPAISTVTASELLHGVLRASDDARRERRSRFVEEILSRLLVMPFDLAQARVHARIWTDLSARGVGIGPHDLQIAACGVTLDWPLATLNISDFQRVAALKVVNANSFTRK
jgi:tRNA(fMet)-specific endonuclease VapC